MSRRLPVLVPFLCLASGLFSFGNSPAHAQVPIDCCEEISLQHPVRAHGYYARVDLTSPQLEIAIPTYPGIECNGPYPTPLVTTVVASFSSAVVSREALAINANFFNWADNNPHQARCAKSIGIAQSGNTQISAPGGRVHNLIPDALLILDPGTAVFVDEPRSMTQIDEARGGAQIRAAASGIMLVRDGRVVCERNASCPRWDVDGFSRHSEVPRTAIGTTADGRHLVIVVFEDDYPRSGRFGTSTGITIDNLAEYLAVHRNVTHAMMLDGSGSSTLIYHPAAAYGVPAVETTPHDTYPPGSGQRQHRPVPVSLVFSGGPQTNVLMQEVAYGFPLAQGLDVVVPEGVEDLVGRFCRSRG